MAEQIQVQHSASGANLYALVRNSSGEVWNTNGQVFEPYDTANLVDYAIAMTEQGAASAFYVADSQRPDGSEVWQAAVYLQGGVSPAEGDAPVKVVDLFGTYLAAVKESSTAAEAAITQFRSIFDDLFAGISSLRLWLQVLFRADTAIATDAALALTEINADEGSGAGAYDNTTDSAEAQSARTPTLVSGRVPADMEAISGSTTAADKLESHAGAVTQVIIGTGSTTTSVVLHASTGVDGGAPPSGADVFNGRVLVITSGALNRQARPIDDYDGSTGTLSIGDGGFTGSAANGVSGVIV